MARTGRADAARDVAPKAMIGIARRDVGGASGGVAVSRAGAAPGPMPERPRLAWRIGVTGHRDIDPATTDALRQAVADLLMRIRRTMLDLARDPDVAAVHAPGMEPDLRLLSPLAEGADRLVAQEALRHGYRLEVVLPFPQDAYERDFRPESVAAFRALLAEARDAAGGPGVVVLDGAPAAARHASYEAVGRFVARNCDFLIAIWDDRRTARRGGTEGVVRAAEAAGVPVWWIDPAAPGSPSLLRTMVRSGGGRRPLRRGRGPCPSRPGHAASADAAGRPPAALAGPPARRRAAPGRTVRARQVAAAGFPARGAPGPAPPASAECPLHGPRLGRARRGGGAGARAAGGGRAVVGTPPRRGRGRVQEPAAIATGRPT